MPRMDYSTDDYESEYQSFVDGWLGTALVFIAIWFSMMEMSVYPQTGKHLWEHFERNDFLIAGVCLVVVLAFRYLAIKTVETFRSRAHVYEQQQRRKEEATQQQKQSSPRVPTMPPQRIVVGR